MAISIARKPPTIALMTALISCSVIAYNLFLPSMPDIARDFGVDVFVVQSSLISFLIAYSLAQFLYGGVADRYGRRPVLLWGLAAYILASLACAAADSITVLILLRIVQGAGAAGSMVMVRAMVRDIYDRQQSARALAIISTVMVLAPATGPAIGGYLHTSLGWQASFLFLAVIGTVLFIYCLLYMAETNPPQGGSLIGNLRAMIGGYRVLIVDKAFVSYVLNIGFLAATAFAWFAGVPIVLIDSYGMTPDEFGFLMLAGTSGAFVGYANTIWLTGRLGVNRMIVLGSIVAFCGGTIYLVLPLAGQLTPIAAIWPMFVFSLGLSMVLPNAMAAAISVRPEFAGTAAAINGLVQYGTATIATIIVGLLPHETHLPLAFVIFGLQIGTITVAWTGWRFRAPE